MRNIKKYIVLAATLGIAACTTPNNSMKTRVFNSDGPTAYEAFQDASSNRRKEATRQQLEFVSEDELGSYWKDVKDTDGHNARYHANPSLYMSIFPRMTDGGTAIPGFDTTYKMYESAPVKQIGE